ncbi:MAG: helix-turn-helix domain-containing protein, partial [Janthinobacterium sp.]
MVAGNKTFLFQAAQTAPDGRFAQLQALGQARGALMLKDLAAAAGMSAAKAHRYLVSFQRLGLVVQDGRSGHYDLG